MENIQPLCKHRERFRSGASSEFSRDYFRMQVCLIYKDLKWASSGCNGVLYLLLWTEAKDVQPSRRLNTCVQKDSSCCRLEVFIIHLPT